MDINSIGTDSSKPTHKHFFFSCPDNPAETLAVIIPEQLHASYGMYTWPCAPVLAWYLWSQRVGLVGKHVIELGAGTSLPGVVAAKCGANVTLSDCSRFTKCLENCRISATTNGVGDKVNIIGLTWGTFEPQLLKLQPVDLIISSDCFYDPAVFEPILVTVSYLLNKNPSASFVCSYKERSSDWSFEPYLSKWKLCCRTLEVGNIVSSSVVDVAELTQDNTIQLFEIYRAS
ncbi:methyltransferase-like protein 23 [Daphnia magna]|uniref:methyltransferase-like protein 23 n=1 Tax=Daphnia magna TaxID=35525 RepID=UPI0006EA7AC7|nr:methyltransferase-like protein 23 [Daphnia magna]